MKVVNLKLLKGCQRGKNEVKKIFETHLIAVNEDTVRQLYEQSTCASLYCAWIIEKQGSHELIVAFWAEHHSIYAATADQDKRKAAIIAMSVKHLLALKEQENVGDGTDPDQPAQPSGDGLRGPCPDAV